MMGENWQAADYYLLIRTPRANLLKILGDNYCRSNLLGGHTKIRQKNIKKQRPFLFQYLKNRAFHMLIPRAFKLVSLISSSGSFQGGQDRLLGGGVVGWDTYPGGHPILLPPSRWK